MSCVQIDSIKINLAIGTGGAALLEKIDYLFISQTDGGVHGITARMSRSVRTGSAVQQ